MSKRNNKVGLPPGSIIFTGNKKVEDVLVHYLAYNGEHNEESVVDSNSYEKILTVKRAHINWYDVRGMHNTELIGALGKHFSMHPFNTRRNCRHLPAA